METQILAKKLMKIGGSYAIVVPKAFVEHGQIDPNKPLTCKVQQVKEAFRRTWSHNLSYLPSFT
jgi:hypothetical protein